MFSLHSGAYNKWVLSGQDNDYLPHWLKAAGYKTECKWYLGTWVGCVVNSGD